MPDTSTWHLPHGGYGRRCDCPGPHLRVDEIHHDPDPDPAHPLAWPTRPLVDTDPLAAAHLGRDGSEAYFCYGCARRRGTHRGTWRVVTQAERDQLPDAGCATCAKPWPRSAFAAAAYFRSPGDASGGGLLCPPCATRPDGGWFEPTGVRRCPGGRAWYRLLRADDPVLIGFVACTRCGASLGTPDTASSPLAAPAPPDARPAPRGRLRYERLPALNGLVPPWPYLAHPWDLRDALAHAAPPLPNPALYRGLRQGGPAWQQWYRRCQNNAVAAAYRVGATAEGPYACESCAAAGLVEYARPLALRELLAEVRPPACGIACYGCARPVIPERWHRAHEDVDQQHQCPGPHLRRDEPLRPPGYLGGFDYARATRPLQDGDVIGGAAERSGTVQLLCPACYARARRSPDPHWPLTADQRPTLPTGCDRCHRPWALSALVTPAEPDGPDAAEIVDVPAETVEDSRYRESPQFDDAELPDQLRRIAERVAELLARAEAAKDDFTLRRGWGVKATGAERGWAHVEMALVGADYDVASHTRAEAAEFLVYDIAADLWELCDELGLDVFREIVRSLEQREERR